MPILSLTPDNKTELASDFPRLKLDSNERKRILCLAEPNFGYVHTLRAPKIVNGRPEYKIVKNNKTGAETTELVKDFIGRPLCLGDLGTLADKGADAVNCPVCKRATETDQVDKPQRRFAMPVIVYQTKAGSFEVASPFQVSLLVWNFTDLTFNKLVDIATEWGNLKDHDLLLGPCTDKVYQRFEIGVARDAAWRASEDRAKLVVDCFRENQPRDLDALIGRKVERSWVEEDLDKVTARWRVVDGAAHDTDGATESLADGLAALGIPAIEKPAPATQSVDLGDILSSSNSLTTTSADNTIVLHEAATSSVPAVVDFNDLLNGM